MLVLEVHACSRSMPVVNYCRPIVNLQGCHSLSQGRCWQQPLYTSLIRLHVYHSVDNVMLNVSFYWNTCKPQFMQPMTFGFALALWRRAFKHVKLLVSVVPDCVRLPLQHIFEWGLLCIGLHKTASEWSGIYYVSLVKYRPAIRNDWRRPLRYTNSDRWRITRVYKRTN